MLQQVTTNTTPTPMSAAGSFFDQTNQACRMLVLSIGDFAFAIPADAVSEIVRMPEITMVPGASASLLGITLLAGDVLAVIKPTHVLPSDQIHQPTKMIVINDHEKEMRVGLPVDRVVEIASLSAEKNAAGTIEHNSTTITVLDPVDLINKLRP